PIIDFERLKNIKQLVSVPLVLHGSSGIGEENLVKAIQLGIRKINLYSEIIQSEHRSLQLSLQESFGNPIKVCLTREGGIKDTLLTYLEFSGSTK
ncbi:MAG: class II fructose-bisphosphate aldolase, partial [Anaerolineales bacterium]